MAGLSSPGIGSGLDINSLVARLMEVERQPLTALDKKEADYQSKLTAYGSLKGALSSFQTSVRGLSSPSKFNAVKATVADATLLTASTTSIAKPGSYQIEVKTLAQAQKLTASAVADPTAALGTGTLTLDFGTYNSDSNTFSVNAAKAAKTITIGSNNSSLNGIRDAINNAGAGVSASIVNDGSGYRLVLTSTDSGVENSIRLKVSGDSSPSDTDGTGLSMLAYDPTAAAGSGKNMAETLAARSAEFKIDGITVRKPTNTVSDAIQGVTLNLLKTNEGSTTTLSVAQDSSGVKAAVEGFVKTYNDMVKTMQDLGGYDAKTKQGGLLLGDSTLRTLQSQLRAAVGMNLNNSGAGVNNLSDIGISFQRDGSLSLNAGKFDKILADPSKNVGALFATMGVPSDSLVSYAGAGSGTQAGKYGINLTQVPARASASGSAVAATTITAGNNTLNLTVDGTSVNVTLNTGTYTADTLVAELQARINSDGTLSALGKKVLVSQDSGKLTVQSQAYGPSSSVAITGGTGLADLFSSVSTTAGANAAGEIGGVAATGAGQMLTANGAASGLQLLINGGNTGDRGTVSFSYGIAYQLNKTLDTMLATKGTIGSRTEGIDSSVKDIESRRAILSRRLADTEKRYRAQFTALDSMVASMQQTSSYLTQQLSALQKSTGNN